MVFIEFTYEKFLHEVWPVVLLDGYIYHPNIGIFVRRSW